MWKRESLKRESFSPLDVTKLLAKYGSSQKKIFRRSPELYPRLSERCLNKCSAQRHDPCTRHQCWDQWIASWINGTMTQLEFINFNLLYPWEQILIYWSHMFSISTWMIRYECNCVSLFATGLQYLCCLSACLHQEKFQSQPQCR